MEKSQLYEAWEKAKKLDDLTQGWLIGLGVTAVTAGLIAYEFWARRRKQKGAGRA